MHPPPPPPSPSYFPISLSLPDPPHYRANLKLVRERGDYAAMGRTVGNLGNTYYLLGNYKKAIKHHEEVSNGTNIKYILAIHVL